MTQKYESQVTSGLERAFVPRQGLLIIPLDIMDGILTKLLDEPTLYISHLLPHSPPS